MSSAVDAATGGQSAEPGETPGLPSGEADLGAGAHVSTALVVAQQPGPAAQLPQEEAKERRLAFADEDRDLWRTIAQDPRQESLPPMNADQLLRGMGVLMNRLTHTEEARRVDRLIINELRGEVMNLKRKLTEVDGVLTSAAENALYCKEAPRFEGLRMKEPREMSIPELKLLQETCEGLRDNDKRLPAVARILGTPPSAEGELSFDLNQLSATKQWELFYYMVHKRVVRRVNPTKRCKEKQHQLTWGPDAASSSVAPLPDQSEESNDESGRASERAWDDDFDFEGEGDGEDGSADEWLCLSERGEESDGAASGAGDGSGGF
jgi:hypothetical protein